MLNLMVKNIVNNSNRIDAIVKHINKSNKKHCFEFLLVAATIYTITKVVGKHEQEICDLKNEIKEMKSKGE